MGQGLAGLGGAAGAGAALERLLARRFQEQQEAARQQQMQQQAAQEQQRIALEARRVAIAEQPEPETPVNMQFDWPSGQVGNPRTGTVQPIPGFRPRPITPENQVLSPGQVLLGPDNKELARGLPPREPQGPQPNYLTLVSPTGQHQRVIDGPQVNALMAQGWKPFDAVQARQGAQAEAENVGKRKVVTALAQETSSVIDQLLTPEGELQPGVSGITGRARVPSILTGVPIVREAASWMSGGDIANKQAAMNRLKGRLVVDLIAEMKAQTRTGATGFGQLSTQEGLLLERAAAQLDQAQTEDQVKDVLNDMRTKLNRIMQEPVVVGAGPSRRIRYDINGNRLPD